MILIIDSIISFQQIIIKIKIIKKNTFIIIIIIYLFIYLLYHGGMASISPPPNSPPFIGFIHSYTKWIYNK